MLHATPGAVAALLLGWGPVAAVVLGGVTYISSSGVIAKTLSDLGRTGNPETPTVLSLLVIEDLAMAVYLPILSAVLVGAGAVAGGSTRATATWTGWVSCYYGRPIRGRGYPTFDELFRPTLREIRTITRKPVVLTETGGTEVGGHKVDFIRAFFAGLRRHPDIIGFNWFEVDKETDWRVVSSPAARAAFAAAIADPRYGALARGGAVVPGRDPRRE